MADPAVGGGGVAAVVTAFGMAAAAVITAWATRKRTPAVTAEDDPESRPAKIRERLSAVEARASALEVDVTEIRDEVALLRAQEIATETLVRQGRGGSPPAPRRRS